MAVEELLVGRTRRRVVVDPGPLDLRPRAWRRRVVQAEQEAFAGHQDAHSQAQQQRGHYAGPWPQAAEEVIILAEVGAQAGRAQPAGHGAPTPGEQHAPQQRQQAPGQSSVQRLAQGEDPGHQLGGQLPGHHLRLSWLRRLPFPKAIVAGEPLRAYFPYALSTVGIGFFGKVQLGNQQWVAGHATSGVCTARRQSLYLGNSADGSACRPENRL